MIYVAFGKTTYIGKATEIPKVHKGPLKEWFEAIVFAVFAATIIRWAFMEAYVIPTPSMEHSLLVGDFLFVSKLEYGPRTPKLLCNYLLPMPRSGELIFPLISVE